MHIPAVDIIVPVWNSPFETRACLAAILKHSPEARLIIVDNGSSRETELMLEEFSEPLGDQGLFIKSERNIGLVPAVNMGLARSDNDVAIVVRPHVLVTEGWLAALTETARDPLVGIVTPVFRGSGAPAFPAVTAGCSQMETFTASFSTLLLKTEMRMLAGYFDESLDSGEWCLKDYVRRAWSKGYRTCVTPRSELICGNETVFGSDERRHEQARISRVSYLQRWGISRHYCVYFGPEADAGTFSDTVDTILQGTRQGHRFTLLLYHRQAKEFRRRGWNAQHTGIELQQLSLLMPQRDLVRKVTALKENVPDIIPIRGVPGIAFPGMESAIPFAEVAGAIDGGKITEVVA
jgi:glycosyltransferase involved in cell wall biosynthesis